MLMKTTASHSPSMTGTSGITLDSLRVAYHGNVVLKPLSLTIEQVAVRHKQFTFIH